MLNGCDDFFGASARHVVHADVASGAGVWVGVVLVHACVLSGGHLTENVCKHLCARVNCTESST